MKLKVTKCLGVVLPNAKKKVNEYFFELKKSKQNDAEIKFDIVSVKNRYVILNIHEELPRGYKLYVFEYLPVTIEYQLEGVFKKYRFELIWD